MNSQETLIQKIEALEKEVRLLKDKEEIRDVLSRYGHCYDLGYFDEWYSLWAEDGRFGNMQGVKAIATIEGFPPGCPAVVSLRLAGWFLILRPLGFLRGTRLAQHRAQGGQLGHGHADMTVAARAIDFRFFKIGRDFKLNTAGTADKDKTVGCPGNITDLP